jgi:hypothetical protein
VYKVRYQKLQKLVGADAYRGANVVYKHEYIYEYIYLVIIIFLMIKKNDF